MNPKSSVLARCAGAQEEHFTHSVESVCVCLTKFDPFVFFPFLGSIAFFPQKASLAVSLFLLHTLAFR